MIGCLRHFYYIYYNRIVITMNHDCNYSGIISNILCCVPWYYVNANKCTEGRRRSTHFIQFRTLNIICKDIYIWQIIYWMDLRNPEWIFMSTFRLRMIMIVSSDVWFLIPGVWCQNVADNQMFQYWFNANILWPVFQRNIWNFVEILESGGYLMPHTQTVTLCYLNSWPGRRTWNINSENLTL